MRRDSKTVFDDEPAYRDIRIGLWLRRGAAIGAVLRALAPAPKRALLRTRAARFSVQRALRRLHHWAAAATHFKDRHA